MGGGLGGDDESEGGGQGAGGRSLSAFQPLLSPAENRQQRQAAFVASQHDKCVSLRWWWRGEGVGGVQGWGGGGCKQECGSPLRFTNNKITASKSNGGAGEWRLSGERAPASSLPPPPPRPSSHYCFFSFSPHQLCTLLSFLRPPPNPPSEPSVPREQLSISLLLTN